MAELILASLSPAASRHIGKMGRYDGGYVSRALRHLATVVLPLALAVLAFAPPCAEASNVQFVGYEAYTHHGGAAVLTSDRVQNYDSFGYSGTLRLELWALAAPYSGGAFTGYKLAEHSLGQLSAGYYFGSINSGSIPYVSPPNGTWTFVIFLTEFTGAPYDDGYSVRDWVNTSPTVVIGPPPGPPPPSVTPQVGLWWNPDESGTGYALDVKHGVLVVTTYSYTYAGAPMWYISYGPITNTTFSAPLLKTLGGQCISCSYQNPALNGDDGTVTINFTSATAATMTLPGRAPFHIEPQAF